MNQEQLTQLAGQGYNCVPLLRRVHADTETALSIYLKLAHQPYTYLFESVQGGETWGRYSIVGLAARETLSLYGHLLRIERAGQVVEQVQVADPLAFIEAYATLRRVPDLPDLPRFCGGLVGYFGYDCVRYVEKKLAHAHHPDPIATPDILLMLSEDLVVFDNLAGTLFLVTHVDPARAAAWAEGQARLDAMQARLAEPLAMPVCSAEMPPPHDERFHSYTGMQAYKDAVQSIREYILAGDVMQVVLSQRMSAPLQVSPLSVYRALRHLNPSPYMFYMDCGAFKIVGSSPEILNRVEAGRVTVRPLAGTRARGATREDDQRLERELLQDPKEIAEHLMLIDLGRNDVGRISETGSVAVTESMAIERYSHVMHIVSNVEGRLRRDLGAMDVLRATLPAGTLSGAPKVRAMEIIDELEPIKRGIYGGAIGYLGFQGSMDLAIAIRTAVVKDGQIHVQAGAGIVADSVPDLEWAETCNKARALFRAVDLAEAMENPTC